MAAAVHGFNFLEVYITAENFTISFTSFLFWGGVSGMTNGETPP